MVRAAMRKAKNETHITNDGARFLNMVVNPMGQGNGAGAKGQAAPYPDGSGNTVLMTLTAETDFSGATSTSGLIGWKWPNTTNSGGGDITSGADVLDDTKTQTAVAHTAFREDTIATAIEDGNENLFRCLSCAIRVNSISAEDDTAGVLYCYHTRSGLRSGAAAYNQNSVARPIRVEEAHFVKRGMTARSSSNQIGSFSNGWINFPAEYGGSNTIHAPVIAFQQLGASTVIHVEWVMHVQVSVDLTTIPFSCTPIAYEPELTKIINLANQFEYAVDGHSFWDWIKRVTNTVTNTVKQVIEPVQQLIPLVGQIAGPILGAVSAL
jgi:hypothetical protein